MNQAQTRRSNPLRGLLIGLALVLIFFPTAREAIISTVGWVLAFGLGILVAAFALLSGSPRR